MVHEVQNIQLLPKLKKKATSEEAVNFKIKMHALLHFAKIEQFNYYHIILISYDPVDLKPLMR